jgi:excisionase family DNA binding protein
MGRTKINAQRRPRNGSVTARNADAPSHPGEVLTLAEAAAYLRVTDQDILRLVRKQGLPGREIGNDWRFSRAGIDNWLGRPEVPSQTRFWQTHFGALKDDPYLADIVHEAYRKRGRPNDGNL